MTILFESSSDILKNGLVVPQHPAEKNLLSINTAPTAQIGNHTTEKKQKRDEQIGANIHLDARLIRKERRRVGFEVDYYTNTRTGEYRVLSYPISVRERVLASEVFPKDLRIELLRRIPGYMKPIPETLDGCASSEGKKSRKRSYSAAVVEEIGAADTPRTAIPSANAALVARRPVGRPRKRLATGIIGLETTSSLSTTATPIAAPPGDIFLGHVVKDQPCPTIRSDTRTVIGRNQSQEPSSPTCTESYLHPITGEEQLDLEHEGKVILCDNKRRHDPKNRGEGKGICRHCIVAGHEYIQTYREHLLTPALLPLCMACTQEAKVKFPSTTGHNDCRCPLQLPSEASSGKSSQKKSWHYCLRCRIQWLERTSIRLAAEEEVRREIVGAGVVKGKTETIFFGRTCICGQHLGGLPFSDDGMEGCAKRCAGCGGIWHDGTPAECEAVTPRTTR